MSRVLLALLIALFLTGGCKAFRAAFDEAPEQTAAKGKKTDNDWFTPKKKPKLLLSGELNATEQAEIERVRGIELKDRTEEMERDRQERKDWVFSR